MNAYRCFSRAAGLIAGGLLLLAAAGSPADPPAKSAKAEKAKAAAQDKNLREIRVAVFDLDLEGVEIQPGAFAAPNPPPRAARNADDDRDEREAHIRARRGAEPPANDPSGQGALTDQINVLLSAVSKVTIVNRDQIRRVAQEHEMALTGLVNTDNAVKLGKFLSAQYIVVGRASRIGQTYYLVLKIVDVETTEQTTVSAKAAMESGFATLLERLAEPLRTAIRKLQRPTAEPSDAALAELRKAAEPLLGKVILVTVGETHVGRPLRDPAAQMAILQRLRSLGFSVIVPKDPVDGWKEALLQTGRYGDKKVDYLLEGEGTSAFAAQLQGLMSCRARVELRLIPVPGRAIVTSDRGVAAGVDLVEDLAAKTALEEAGTQACDAVVRRWAAETKKPKQ
ncbi:MAG: hypothetical protein ACLQLG_10720 [Thermoguttaceae bacterium]